MYSEPTACCQAQVTFESTFLIFKLVFLSIYAMDNVVTYVT